MRNFFKKYLISFLVWPIALTAIPSRDILFGGQIHVWPFIISACALTFLRNKPLAIALAVGIGGSQAIERFFDNPEAYQFAFYATLGFIYLVWVDIFAAMVAAVVSVLYLLATLAIDWRLAMIISEVVVVAGLSFGAFDGPSGGIYGRSKRLTTARAAGAFLAVCCGRLVRFSPWRSVGH